jgi:Na+/H+-translocating membrane pyrophosphatase
MDFNRGHDNRLRNIGWFSLGAESIALFARVGGGIYTKRDVGADLVESRSWDSEDDPSSYNC